MGALSVWFLVPAMPPAKVSDAPSSKEAVGKPASQAAR